MLVSANQGIAVGMASQICGFNLGEVCDTAIAYLKNPAHDIASQHSGTEFSRRSRILIVQRTMSGHFATPAAAA